MLKHHFCSLGTYVHSNARELKGKLPKLGDRLDIGV